MLPFNPDNFISQYPTITIDYGWDASKLTQLWYDEALVLGRKLLAMLNDNTPLNPTTGSVNSWNASTNTPTLNNAVPELNAKYLCTVAGTVNFGAGNIVFKVYDIVAFNNLLMQWINIGQPYSYYWASVILAHIVSLYNRPVVGRLDEAKEGDVSGNFNYQDTLSSAWWNQTTYGARIWKLLSQRGGFTAYPYNPYQGILYQGNNNVYNH